MPKPANPSSGGAPGASLPFPKSARILRSADFRTVYDQGLRVSNPLFAAFCLARTAADSRAPDASSSASATGAIQRDAVSGDAIPSTKGAVQRPKGAIQRDAVQRVAIGGPRLGITASRAFGGAVLRNRIKRRLREAFRMHRSELAPHWDIVINPRRAAIVASFVEIEQALMKVIAKCGH